jgi:hypothetical protein
MQEGEIATHLMREAHRFVDARKRFVGAQRLGFELRE